MSGTASTGSSGLIIYVYNLSDYLAPCALPVCNHFFFSHPRLRGMILGNSRSASTK